jgi:hypothetical protein
MLDRILHHWIVINIELDYAGVRAEQGWPEVHEHEESTF